MEGLGQFFGGFDSGEVAGGKGELEVIAAAGAGKVEHFADDKETGNAFTFEGVGLDFRQSDATGGDHGLFKAAGGEDGAARTFEGFNQLVDLPSREIGASLLRSQGA